MSVFSSLIDQSEVVNVLQEAVKSAQNKDDSSQGMTHAWLFTGPPGSGRSNAAIAFAAALVCKDGGCSKCVDCMSTITGSHADVELIKTEGLSIKIDEIRDLISRSSWAPSVAAWRVVVIEDADRLTDSAANALLKVVEEPGLRTVWLLCAPTLTDVLPTIRSRCRHLSLRTPSTKAITKLLIERDSIDAVTAEFVAMASGGHIGRARRLATDTNAKENRKNIMKLPFAIKDIASAFKAAQYLVEAAKADALTDSEAKDELEISKLKEAWGGSGSKLAAGGSKAVKELEKEQKSRSTRMVRDYLDRALLDLSTLYRDVLLVQSGSNDSLVNEDLKSEISKIALSDRPERALKKIEAILKTRSNLAQNAAPLLLIEALMCELR
ncbi:MAG: DNA polymerase III subunit delta' [Actinobacteria bacterium]|nr:DNA polymerase III subunit delta' [Actinomycetota bacterium]